MITPEHPLFNLEARTLDVLEQSGPVTGQKLFDQLTDASPVELWKVCYESNLIRVINCARYYLRYDITRENQLRLSPSILRDFLTFSLIFLPDQRTLSLEYSAKLANKHRVISRRKIHFARQVIMSLDEDIKDTLNSKACTFISGDVAYYLAHNTPRVHSELETKVNGSDIDIVFVYNHHIDQAFIKDAETQILRYKNMALKNPKIGEEIDFIFKPIPRMLSQMAYRNIHDKIASKILYESLFLFGSIDIYEGLLSELKFSGAHAKIERDFQVALSERKETFRKILTLLDFSGATLDSEVESLFYFSQERLEFQ